MNNKNKIIVVGAALLMLIIVGLVVWFYLIPKLDEKKVRKVEMNDAQKLSHTLLEMTEGYFKNNDLYNTDDLSYLKLKDIQYLGKKDNILTYYLTFNARCKTSKEIPCLYVSQAEDIDYTKKFVYKGFVRIKEENGYYTLVEFDEGGGYSTDMEIAENLMIDPFTNYMKEQYDFEFFEIETVKFLKYTTQPIYEIKGTFRCENSNSRCLTSSVTENNFDYIVGARKENNQISIEFVDETTNYEIIK